MQLVIHYSYYSIIQTLLLLLEIQKFHMVHILLVIVMTLIEFVRGPSPAPVLHETSIM